MTEADDIRRAGVAAGDEIRSATDEGVRVAAIERLRLTEQVQDDRRDDAPPERQLTAERVQQDRRDDEAPRTALELVRADKLTHSLVLLEAVRKMCLALLVVLVVVGVGMVFLFDYMGDNRGRIDNLQDEIQNNNDATERVENLFRDFATNNQAYLDNHARTQRLICDWYRANNQPYPANGDCDNR